MNRPISPTPSYGKLYAGHFSFVGKNSYYGWRPQGTKDWLLIYTANGSGKFQVGNESFLSGKGDLTLWEPNSPQDYKIDPEKGEWELLWFHFPVSSRLEKWVNWPVLLKGLRKITIEDKFKHPQVLKVLTEIVYLNRNQVTHGEELALNGLERQLIFWDQFNPRSSHLPLDERVEKAMSYLNDHLQKGFELEALCRHCHLSSSRLLELFKKQTGQTPSAFLEKQRMAQAKHLLLFSQKNISEISELLGFKDPFYFSTRFRRCVGVSPKHYRETKEV